MKCTRCKKETTSQESIAAEGGPICIDCVVEMGTELAHKPQVSGEQLRQAKKLIKEELGELVPRDEIRRVVELGFGKILLKEMDPEVAYGWIANQLAIMFTLRHLRDKLKVLGELQNAFDGGLEELSDEVRSLIKKIHGTN